MGISIDIRVGHIVPDIVCLFVRNGLGVVDIDTLATFLGVCMHLGTDLETSAEVHEPTLLCSLL